MSGSGAASRGSNSPLLNLTTPVSRPGRSPGARGSGGGSGTGAGWGQMTLATVQMDWPERAAGSGDVDEDEVQRPGHLQQASLPQGLAHISNGRGNGHGHGHGHSYSASRPLSARRSRANSSAFVVMSQPVSPAARSPHHSAAGSWSLPFAAFGSAANTGAVAPVSASSGSSAEEDSSASPPVDPGAMSVSSLDEPIAAFGKLPRRTSFSGRKSAPHSRRNSHNGNSVFPSTDVSGNVSASVSGCVSAGITPSFGPLGGRGVGDVTSSNGSSMPSSAFTTNANTRSASPESSPPFAPLQRGGDRRDKGKINNIPSLRGWAAAIAASPRLKEMEAQFGDRGNPDYSPRVHPPAVLGSLGIAASNSSAGRVGRLAFVALLLILCGVGAVLYRSDLAHSLQRQLHHDQKPVIPDAAILAATTTSASTTPPPPVLMMPSRTELDLDDIARALQEAAPAATQGEAASEAQKPAPALTLDPTTDLPTPPAASNEKVADAAKPSSRTPHDIVLSDGDAEHENEAVAEQQKQDDSKEGKKEQKEQKEKETQADAKTSGEEEEDKKSSSDKDAPAVVASTALASSPSSQVALTGESDPISAFQLAWPRFSDPSIAPLLSPDPASLVVLPKYDYDSMYKPLAHLRALQIRQKVEEALTVLEHKWEESLTEEQKQRERHFWAAQHHVRSAEEDANDPTIANAASGDTVLRDPDHFERPERYFLEETRLFPEVASPSPVKDKSDEAESKDKAEVSAGRYMKISGRYHGDKIATNPEATADDPSNYAFHYELCSFEHVCLSERNPQSLWFHARNVTEYLRMELALARCKGGRLKHLGQAPSDEAAAANPYLAAESQRILCNCFHAAFVPRMREYEWSLPAGSAAKELMDEVLQANPMDEAEYAALLRRVDALPANEAMPAPSAERVYADPLAYMSADSNSEGTSRDHDHFWAVNKWVPHHHLAHWAQKLLMWQSIMQHAHVFYGPTVAQQAGVPHPESEDPRAHQPFPHPLPALTGVVFQDSDYLTSEHEEAVLEISMRAALGPESAAYAGHAASTGTQVPPTPPAFIQRKHWFDDSGRVIWSDDIRSGKYATNLPPVSGGAVSRKWEGMDRGVKAPLRSEEEIAAAGGPYYTCFRRMSYTPYYGELSLHPKDSMRWRALMRRGFAQRQQLQAMRRLKETHPQLQLAAPDATLASKALKELLPGVPVVAPLEAPRVQLAEDSGFGGVGGCPPRRISLLWRDNRHFLNPHVLLDLLARKFNLTWFDTREWLQRGAVTKGELAATEEEKRIGYVVPRAPRADELVQLQYTSISESSSSLDQQALFLSSGLVVSPHSSQLVNVLFSPRAAAIVEVTPEFHNNDFARYAVGMGLDNFQYMLGGCELEADPLWNNGQVSENEAVTDCVRSLNDGCQEGVGLCVLKESGLTRVARCPLGLRSQNKYLNFHVRDLALFERVLGRAIAGIEERCERAAKRAGLKHEGWAAGFKREREEHAKHYRQTEKALNDNKQKKEE